MKKRTALIFGAFLCLLSGTAYVFYITFAPVPLTTATSLCGGGSWIGLEAELGMWKPNPIPALRQAAARYCHSGYEVASMVKATDGRTMLDWSVRCHMPKGNIASSERKARHC